jgi:acylphosphatase
MTQIRREIHFEGRVQGVGFRQTTRSTAAQFRVVGYVQNLPDGRVLLVAEGDSAELDRFVAEIAVEMGHNIRRQQVDEFPAAGEFDEFDIRF